MPRSRAGARLPGIQAVVQLIKEHRVPIARTLRETHGIGLSDLGDGVTWGEAKTLLEDAAADGGTVFGAWLAGWAYPASMRELIALSAQIGDPKVSKRLMPWAMDNPRRRQAPRATPDEIATAEAELDAEYVFN